MNKYIRPGKKRLALLWLIERLIELIVGPIIIVSILWVVNSNVFNSEGTLFSSLLKDLYGYTLFFYFISFYIGNTFFFGVLRKNARKNHTAVMLWSLFAHLQLIPVTSFIWFIGSTIFDVFNGSFNSIDTLSWFSDLAPFALPLILGALFTVFISCQCSSFIDLQLNRRNNLNPFNKT